MADRLQFKEKLAGVLALAEDQNGKITVMKWKSILKRTDFRRNR